MKYTLRCGSFMNSNLSHYELNSYVQELLDMGFKKEHITITVDE